LTLTEQGASRPLFIATPLFSTRPTMTTREGNLEAPTRHAVDWKNPDFYDQAS
jgi:hypothetical protein